MTETRAERYSLKKHPELYYLGDNKYHICPECNRQWQCETAMNYGVCGDSEHIETCYQCKNITWLKAKYIQTLPKFIVEQLVKSHKEAKQKAKLMGALVWD